MARILIKLIVFSLFIILFSCNRERVNLKIKEDKLVEIIIDVQVAKAATYKYPVHLRDSINTVYNEQIYEIHGISKYELEHDMEELESNPKYYRVLIDTINAKMKGLLLNEDQRDMEKYD